MHPHRVAMFLAVVAISGSVAACRGSDEDAPACPTNSLEDRYGIRVTSVRLAAAGGMVDVRYQVVDPARASAFHALTTRPELVSEATGSRYQVPTTAKAGSLRQRPREPVPGRTYFLLFANHGGTLRPGDRVDLVVGDARSDGAVVL